MADKTFNYSINEGFLWSEVNLKGEKKYYIEGYASTIDEDKSGEILDITAQQDIHNQIQAENITMDIEHEEWYGDDGKILARPKNEKIPVAKIISSELRPRGVWVKAEINTNLKSFSQIWGSIKDGFLKAFSVAFYPVQKTGGIIKHLNLINVTLTGSPVNPHATFAVSMKSAAAWLDSQEQMIEDGIVSEKVEVKADKNIIDKTPEIKAEDKMAEEKEDKKEEFKCKECDKVFDSKDALDAHKEKAHSEDKKEEKAEVKAVDVHVAEIKALQEEVAKLKAELAQPVMKAVVEKAIPQEKPVMQIVSPLNLVR